MVDGIAASNFVVLESGRPDVDALASEHFHWQAC